MMETKRTDGAWRKDKQSERDNRRLLAQQGPDRNRKIPPCVRTVMAHLDSSAWALHHFPLFFLMSWLRPSLSLSLFLAKQQQRDDSRREKKKKRRAGASTFNEINHGFSPTRRRRERRDSSLRLLKAFRQQQQSAVSSNSALCALPFFFIYKTARRLYTTIIERM